MRPLAWAAAASVAVAVAAASPAAADELGFGDRVEPFADFALRYRLDAWEPGAEKLVSRGRLRLAAGLRFRAARSLVVVARLRARDAAADPKVSFVELGRDFDLVGVGFDRAYARLTPLPGLALCAGLVEHPARSSPALWDPDLAPAGATALYEKRLRSLPLYLRPSAFAYVIRSDADGKPAGLAGGQLAATASPTAFDVTAAAAAYLFDNVDALAARSRENGIDAAGDFEQGFALVEARLITQLHVLSFFPVEIGGTAIFNAAADRDRFGFTAGLAVGVREWPGDFRVAYQYRYIERDAVLAALASDDQRPATDYRSHSIAAGYQIAGDLAARATGYLFRTLPGDNPATPFDEGQLQAEVKVDLIADL